VPGARIQLTLLGGLVLRDPSGAPFPLPGRKAQALLGYLALRPGAQARETLATLLWGDSPDERARHSLRQALVALRRALGGAPIPLLVEADETVALDGRAADVDVVAFERAVAAATPASLEAAAALYRGDLLEGIDVQASGFEEWLLSERERLRELAVEALAKLLAHQVQTAPAETAIGTALRLLVLEPAQEAVHRTLMRLYARQERRAAALQQYQVCVTALQQELGIEPEEKTRALYRELLRGAGGSPGARRRAVASPPGSPGGGTTAHPALVGRAAELGALRDALEQALDHGARVAVVTGEAGIGKSRLVEELRAEAAARGARLLWAWCYETERSLPFRPWVDAFRAEQAALDPVLVAGLRPVSRGSLARVFPELARPDEPMDVESDRHGLLFEAMGELAGLVSAEQPVVLVIEDLHWADAMSARLLAFLGRRLGSLPVLILGSTRPEEAVDAPDLARALAELRDEGRLAEIPLGPLSRDESLTLARALRPGAADAGLIERVADELWAVSEGNPFVIVETVRALGQGTAAGEARGLIAPSVRDSVTRRLARLSDLARRAVDGAAVIGRSFPFRFLPEASSLAEPEAATAVEELVRRRVLEAVGEELAFCHDRIRKVVYEGLLPPRRRLLHGAVARVLETVHAGRLEWVADRLAFHHARSDAPERAVVHLGRLAEAAAHAYAHVEAVAALQEAIVLVEHGPAAERDRRVVELALRQAFSLSVLGRFREVLDLVLREQPRLERLDLPALAAQYAFRLAMTHTYLGDLEAAARYGARALADAERCGDGATLGKAHYVLAFQSYTAGQGPVGAEHARLAIPLLEAAGESYWLGLAQFMLGLNHHLIGEFAGALQAADQAEAIGEAVGDGRLRTFALHVRGMVFAARGEGPASIVAFQRALEVSVDPYSRSIARARLGHAYLEGGDSEQAVALLEEATQFLRHAGSRAGIGYVLAFLAEAWLDRGDRRRARALAEESLAVLRESRSDYWLQLTRRMLGRIARAEGALDEAESALAQALEGLAAIGSRFEAARTRLDLAELEHARGQTAAAAAHLAAARETFVALQVPRYVERADALAAGQRSSQAFQE
jgi:DNA-binding SARP family transcriptional activator